LSFPYRWESSSFLARSVGATRCRSATRMSYVDSFLKVYGRNVREIVSWMKDLRVDRAVSCHSKSWSLCLKLYRNNFSSSSSMSDSSATVVVPGFTSLALGTSSLMSSLSSCWVSDRLTNSQTFPASALAFTTSIHLSQSLGPERMIVVHCTTDEDDIVSTSLVLTLS
jgi:hypothetical protein